MTMHIFHKTVHHLHPVISQRPSGGSQNVKQAIVILFQYVKLFIFEKLTFILQSNYDGGKVQRM